ncbi:pentatricopeptide repeat-containing protein At4g01990, mitochondrial-like [Cornus florida]|uniref:pentatricopeptide repeat-containing protein At4g01990, mitochondrial-like n=1 Tax=Cornus florida TaxID=4283 RepID=UPI0028A20192|nr:pentatricopeptide repeat-containing protein At4g01990, mitochondrial-like [Cornus florida]XP_059648419.1 pentatricopeptide repeat-containing protein At4g01990, mitochondrial-like [Cornus florida]XP_059648420.1 pentatricopeptide repeat-containing protein At4g01990, mitochondrial-like [Cornus florida]
MGIFEVDISKTPNNTSYGIMLSVLSKLGDVDGLEKCFREWEAGCPTYAGRASKIRLLKAYLSRDMIKEVDAAYNSTLDRVGEPKLGTLNSLIINFCLKNHQMDLALKYLEMGCLQNEPGKAKWFLSDEAVNTFLTNFEEKKDVDGAEKFRKNMKKIGLNSKIIDSLLLTHTAAGTDVPQIRQRLEEYCMEMSPKMEKLLHELHCD